MRSDAKKRFEEANHLWFEEGYIAEAIAAYKEAFRLSGDDPVIGFQLAFALSARGRKNEALEYLAIVGPRLKTLGEEGAARAEHLEQECRIPVHAGRWSPDDLDFEKLIHQNLGKSDWFGIALDAQEFQLNGVALLAYQKSQRGFLDLDKIRDEENLRLDIESHLNLLRRLRKEADKQSR